MNIALLYTSRDSESHIPSFQRLCVILNHIYPHSLTLCAIYISTSGILNLSYPHSWGCATYTYVNTHIPSFLRLWTQLHPHSSDFEAHISLFLRFWTHTLFQWFWITHTFIPEIVNTATCTYIPIPVILNHTYSHSWNCEHSYIPIPVILNHTYPHSYDSESQRLLGRVFYLLSFNFILFSKIVPHSSPNLYKCTYMYMNG